MEFSEVINKRRSHRAFLDQPVERHLIEKLISAASKAPVSCNLQLTKYIVVDDKELLSKLSKEVSYKFNYAPCTIVVAYDNRYTIQRHSAATGAGMAMENLVLQAVDLGLGTCPMAGFGKDEVIKKILGIPDHFNLALLIAVGYPDESVQKTNIPKIDSSQVYSFNRFQNLDSIDPSPDLDNHSIASIVDYRKRIAPVYLDRFRLNTWSDKFYKEAYRLMKEKFFSKVNHEKIFDIMSYDGKFLQLAKEDNQNIEASDYVKHNLEFFADKLHVKTHLINKKNKIDVEDNSQDLITMVFQIQHTPEIAELMSSIYGKLRDGGHLIVATSNSPMHKHFAKWLIKKYKQLFKKQAHNIYENNPFYKVGPFKYYTETNKRSIFAGAGFEMKEKIRSEKYPGVKLYLLKKV